MNGNATIVVLISLLAGAWTSQAQSKFSTDMLQNPGMYSAEFEALFALTEIPIYTGSPAEDEILLENGYATYDFQNPSEWSPQGAQIEPVEVTVIFTKYPKHKGFWLTDYHWLLARRLETLFALDPRFNEPSVEFNILLQTDCDNEPEAMQLFHGILVKYRPIPESLSGGSSTMEAQSGKKESSELPPRAGVNHSAVKKLNRFTDKIPELEDFRDSTVYHVLERSPWEKAVMVIDWTGSMYGYGAQGLMWHVENERTSGIEQVVMFNDGDSKKRSKKIPGYTGGIYMEDAKPATRPLKMLTKVKNRGNGGDAPENDIEALYTSILENPSANEFILVADNNSCIRDFALLASINRPIRIILCKTKKGINPQYLNLAYRTGGSIHLEGRDIMNLREMVEQDSLVIDGVKYTLTINNLIVPLKRNESAFRWCDRYYELNPRQKKKVVNKQKRRDPKCYFKE